MESNAKKERRSKHPKETQNSGLDLREISRAGFLAALGLALPPIFHMVRLGHVFLPMFLPILAGGFLLRPRLALLVGFSTPLVSAALTGMPPVFPPVAIWMSLELGLMAWAIATIHRQLHPPIHLTLGVMLISGRLFYLFMVFVTSQFLDLPAVAFTLLSLVKGWPGIILCMVAIPPTVAAVERLSKDDICATSAGDGSKSD